VLASPVCKYQDFAEGLADIKDVCERIEEAFPVKDQKAFNLALGSPGLRVMIGNGWEPMTVEHKVRLLSMLLVYEKALNMIHRNVTTTTPLSSMIPDFRSFIQQALSCAARDSPFREMADHLHSC
jgi:hypothetical protein